MDRNENNNYEKLTNNNYEFDKQYEKFIPDVPVAVDRRAPQLNEANDSCHCSCPCARGGNNNGGDAEHAGGDASTSMDINEDFDNQDVGGSDTSSDFGDEAVKHDEGVEEQKIEVGDFGLIPVRQIMRSLAKRNRCTCHHGLGILPSEDDYPFPTLNNSPAASGFLTPGDSASMIVEAASSSGEQSMESSQVLSISSRGSSLLGAIGAGFPPVPIFRPLSLTPEVKIRYPIDIDLSLGEFVEFDMW